VKDKDEGCAVWLLIIIIAIVYWNDIPDIWNSKFRFALSLHVTQDKITVQNKPHDCEFMSAPIGRKNCHYESVVEKVEWATSAAGKPIMSFDDGKSWEPFTPPPGANVPQYSTVESAVVSWNHVAE
jgi:hypothetical protein